MCKIKKRFEADVEWRHPRTMTAVGVASPTAQGQAMTSVAMPKFSAKMKWLLSLETQSPGKLSVKPAACKSPPRTALKLTSLE